MRRYEHRWVQVTNQSMHIDALLKQMGSDGWRVCGVVALEVSYFHSEGLGREFYFVRELAE